MLLVSESLLGLKSASFAQLLGGSNTNNSEINYTNIILFTLRMYTLNTESVATIFMMKSSGGIGLSEQTVP